MPLRLLSRLVACLAVVLAFLWIVQRSVGLFGAVTIEADFREPARFLSDVRPIERRGDLQKSEDGRWGVPLYDSPVFLDISPLADFDRLTVTATFSGEAPGATIGALANAETGQFRTSLLHLAALDALTWPAIASNGQTLYQRTPKFSSIDDFLAAPPPPSSIGLAGAAAATAYSIPGYTVLTAPATTRVSLHGHHRFLVYADNEPLLMEFDTQDMNRADGADPVEVLLTRYGTDEAVLSARLADDGNDKDDQRQSAIRTVALSAPSLRQGVYQVTFSSTDDIFIRAIRTTSRKWVAVDRVYLGDNIGYSPAPVPTTLLTNATELSLALAHPEFAQTAKVGTASVMLDRPGHAVVAAGAAGGGTVSVTVPKNDTVIEGNGTFAFSASSFFDPRPFLLAPSTTLADLDRRGIDFVLAGYTRAPAPDGAHAASATFRRQDLALAKTGAYRLALEVPGAGEGGRGFHLERLVVRLERDHPIGIIATLRNLGTLLGARHSIVADSILLHAKTYARID